MRNYYKEALSTKGFFSEQEAQFLIANVNSLKNDANILEVGSYYGRSTLFMLSAMKESQKLISLDKFVKVAGYSNSTHSFWKLLNTVNDRRHTLIPNSLDKGYEHLKETAFDLCFIDGNHSFVGVTTDLSYSIMLCKLGGFILCHDVCELFPGIEMILESLESKNVLKKISQVNTLAKYEVLEKPTWLIDPAVYKS